MHEQLIRPNFKIPQGYRREFVFEDPAVRFRHKIVVDHVGVHVWDVGGPVPALTTSRCLDWIEEVMSKVRLELEA